jgi:hypothetical protein
MEKEISKIIGAASVVEESTPLTSTSSVNFTADLATPLKFPVRVG